MRSVILNETWSAPLRLRSLFSTEWRSSGPVCEGCAMFYSVLTVERLISVLNRHSKWIPEDPPGPSYRKVCVHLHAKTIKCCRHKKTGILSSHSLYSICTWLTQRRLWGCYQKVNCSCLTVLTNGFQWLTSPLHQIYQTLKYSWLLKPSTVKAIISCSMCNYWEQQRQKAKTIWMQMTSFYILEHIL